jgi:tripartite-type tricarboxylate transporter receptor subunit TctC
LRLARAAGVEFSFVPYPDGAPQAIADVAAGRVSFLIEGLAGMGPAIRSGLVKPLAVLSSRRLTDNPIGLLLPRRSRCRHAAGWWWTTSTATWFATW